MKLMLVFVGMALSLLSCTSLAQKGESSAAKNGASSTIQTSSTKSQSADSNNQRNASELKNTPVREPSRDELESLIPSSVRQRMRCSIEENVVVKPEEGSVHPLTVSFDATASFAPCGKIVKWLWDFGDGSTGKGVKVTHTYNKPGEYVVNLSLADTKGNVNFVQLDYVVRISAGEPTQLTVKSMRHGSRHKKSKSTIKN